jgi:hypothetical protein
MLPWSWLKDAAAFYRDNILMILGLIGAMAVICLVAGLVAHTFAPGFRPDKDSKPLPDGPQEPVE